MASSANNTDGNLVGAVVVPADPSPREPEGICAHLRVSFVTKDLGHGVLAGHWLCDECLAPFFLSRSLPAEGVTVSEELAECAKLCAHAEKEALRYREALSRFGAHDEECPAIFGEADKTCDCGLTAALAARGRG